MSDAHFTYVLRLGDNALVLGQRLSEWCGHSPFLEEDIAMANTALDLIGRARMLYSHAGRLEGRGRDEDALAYLRDEREFGNFLMCELPNGDYGFTLVRQYLLDVYHRHLYAALTESRDDELAAIAAKAVKEAAYHARRSGDWVLRLGDGTAESNARCQAALDELWGYTAELFTPDAVDSAMLEAGVAPDLATLRTRWEADVLARLAEAGLTVPADDWQAEGGRAGRHTEHMGRLLAELQFVQRAYPGQQW
ncbi:MAG: phenylacetate-CoA oxygenase subunit PaaC [Gammaproteobacteria bacterium]|nr:phenylacetate-CoA oxygenase subunit PaaC [Gammaproteobacteria bacterium]